MSYALHPLPLSEVRALRCRTPLLLVASLVLVLQDGLSLPPLHFHAGGLQELIKCLKKASLPVQHQSKAHRACTLRVPLVALHGLLAVLLA